MLRTIYRRFLLLTSILLLAGCAVFTDGRQYQPVPAPLLALMHQKLMTPADPVLIRIYKQESELEVWKRDWSGRYSLLKTYPVCMWSGHLGRKTRQGDGQTPEGFYAVTRNLLNGHSKYYLSLNVGYPNTLDQSLGYSGGHIMIHGGCVSDGCFAMRDNGVAEIFVLARDAFAGGQDSIQVQSFPFRMTGDNMDRHRNDPNFGFWENLKEGADLFDATHLPPEVGMEDGRYVFVAGPFAPPPEDTHR